MEKQQLKDLTLEEMQKWVESLGEKNSGHSRFSEESMKEPSPLKR